MRDVSLRIPKRGITVFTGVSGSGKSSLVFDTLAAEAQRQLNETFTTFIRNRLPKYGQPDADAIENLSTAAVVDQRRIGGNSRSTVGTITDIHAMLRLLFSRVGRPFVGYSNAFSFNDPEGMCPECSGIGKKTALDLAKFFDKTKALDEGAMLHPEFKVGSYRWTIYAHSGFFDTGKKLSDYTDEEWGTLLYGKPGKIELKTLSGFIKRDNFEGVVDMFNRLHINKEGGAASDAKRDTLRRFVSVEHCPACDGTRLNEAARSCKIDGRNIADFAAMEVGDLVEVVGCIKDPVAAPMVSGAVERLQNLVDIGLGYLSLDRETSTLSGGESQRIKMVRHLGSSLSDMMYIFDEPTIGLHPRDVHRLNDLLRKLRDKGNTVLVVEHDPDVIEIADHVVDIGPRAGIRGGEIVYEGNVAGLLEADTPTGRCMRESSPLKKHYREPTGYLPIVGATLHNLKGVSVDVPEGVLTAVTGVAGSGKNTLVNGVFPELYPEAVVIDQSSIGRSIRSNPATYTGIMDDIRRLFARANDVSPALFSFNSKGACPNCRGLGFIHTDLAFLEPLKTPCEVCGGKRFDDEALGHTLRGRSIAEALGMTARDALGFFEEEILDTLRAIHDVGLDYLTLGQPLSTLSGGERQRIKIASELRKDGNIYVLDEPTTGLHMSDVGRLLGIMDRLVDGGNSVVVVEHNLDVVGNADWIIDLGPEAGKGGGEVVFEGTPMRLLDANDSLTGAYLRERSAADTAASEAG
ncbi:MAG: ATP-binding cassette domain-containing protein [Rubrobacteraceae bacterium]